MKADENELGSNIMRTAEKYIANDHQILYNSVVFCLLFVLRIMLLILESHWSSRGKAGVGLLSAPLP